METFPPTFAGLQDLVARLRGPEGCPWDREQTGASMRHFVLEETYELLEAIEGDDAGAVAEELGDVMFHLVFQVHMAKEEGRFDEAAVFRSVIDKLVRRHPHVFGDTNASGAQEVLANWQDLKRAEKGEDDDSSILDGVPKSLPALAQAHAIQQRAAGVGFDWEDAGAYVPAVLTAIVMPFTFSIANGIAIGFISYAVINTVIGNARELHPAVWLLAAASLLLLVFMP